MLRLKISDVAYVFLLCFTASVTLITTTKAATDESYLSYFCPNTNTFSPNTTYQSNLNQLLSLLSSNSTRKISYYNTTVGINNTVYGAFLCRGDLTTNACKDCVSTAAARVLQKCPVEKESVIWFSECMLRYSNHSFFSIAADETMMSEMDTANVSEQSGFMQVLGNTMNAVAEQAANGGGDKKFATKEANYSSFQTLYTLAQCTPDLSQFDCDKCLKEAIENLPTCCYGRRGGRVLLTSCNIRYELYPFYRRLMVPSTQVPKTKGKEKSQISVVIIVAIVAPIVPFSLVTFFACWIISIRARQKVPEESASAVQISSEECLQYDFDTIIAATNNFGDHNKLGEGGFGKVYKGKLLNGKDIAVKRLSRSSRQGVDEFKNEVFLLAKLQHRNLVRLLGFCLDGEENMLIYEFVPNKSLDHFLLDPEKQQQLNWPRRYKIIEGIARAMLYLHEDSRFRIIHRDLKASNILLDKDFNPKISDFGMARICGADQTQGNTRRIVGTFGYMSPEYAMHGRFSVKMDVYSFGVLVLEIISGKKITSFHESGYARDLLNYAWRKWRDGMPLELLDVTLRDSYSRVEVSRCIHIGLSCVQEDPARRPTMQTIVLMLSRHSVTIAAPERPAGYLHSKTQQSFPTKELENSDNMSTDQPVSASVDEASITQVYPR